MMPPFGWRSGFLTWLSSSILRLRLSISMFCWLFLSCSSEMVCFCWLPCSCSSCRDERSKWCLSSSDDTCSCCSEKAKVGVKDDDQYITLNIESAHYTQWGGEGELVQCAGRTLIKFWEVFVCEHTSSCRIWVLTLCSSCSAMARSVTHNALALLSSYKKLTSYIKHSWCTNTCNWKNCKQLYK